MEVNRPNTKANDLAMQRLQEQLLKAQEDGIEGMPTSVSITRPDGTEIADEDVQVVVTGGFDISDKDAQIAEEQEKINIQNAIDSAVNPKDTGSRDSSLDEIIATWHMQANIERFFDGTAPIYTDLLNPYQLQGQSPVLNFEDLVNLGALMAQQNPQAVTETAQTGAAAQTEAATKTESVQSSSAAESVEEAAKTSTDKTSTPTSLKDVSGIVSGEENIGSLEYAVKALKLALPDIDISKMTLYYDLNYDENGRLIGMTKNSIYENMDLPSFVLGYPDMSKSESTENCINIIWEGVDLSDSKGVEVVKNKDGTILAMSLDSEGELAETRFYDKDYKDSGISKNLAAGESYTYKGIKVTNPTSSPISITFLISEGLLAVKAKGAKITAVTADDAISTDKVVILNDEENPQSYKDYKKALSEDDSDSDSDTEEKLKKLNNITALMNNLPNILGS